MGNGTGITGLVLSIIGVGLVFALPMIAYMLTLLFSIQVTFFQYMTLVLPIIGTILSIVGIATNDSKAPGIVGLVFGLIGVAIASVSIFMSLFLDLFIPYTYY